MTLKADERSKLYALFDGEELVVSDVLQQGDHMATAADLTVVTAEDENAYVGALAEHVAELPALPDEGWLEAGAIYSYAGKAVMVRQSHMRTIYPPSETLALFVTYREDVANLEWIPAETVVIGTRRTYDGKLYECLQAHVTEAAFVPSMIPALWKAVVVGVQPWVQPTGAHDVYHIGDRVTHNGSTWECTAGDASGANSWEPGVYGWTKV
jgi:hypothetical protein